MSHIIRSITIKTSQGWALGLIHFFLAPFLAYGSFDSVCLQQTKITMVFNFVLAMVGAPFLPSSGYLKLETGNVLRLL
jgi:hypothetical protein